MMGFILALAFFHLATAKRLVYVGNVRRMSYMRLGMRGRERAANSVTDPTALLSSVRRWIGAIEGECADFKQ